MLNLGKKIRFPMYGAVAAVVTLMILSVLLLFLLQDQAYREQRNPKEITPSDQKTISSGEAPSLREKEKALD